MSAVWELAGATLGGAVLGGAGVYVWVRWVVRPKPLRIQHRKVDPAKFARLTETFGPKLATGGVIRHVPPVGESGCTLRGEHGPELDLDPVRYTYVQGPIRNRDTDHE